MSKNNHITLRGNLGKDTDTRILEVGSVSRLNLATNESYKDKKSGEWITTTEWHTVVCWRKVSDIVKDLKKGQTIIVTGSIKSRDYQDSNGVTRQIKEVIADHVDVLVTHNKNDVPMPNAQDQPSYPKANIIGGGNPNSGDNYAANAKKEADELNKELDKISGSNV